jgi:hypothetical protein
MPVGKVSAADRDRAIELVEHTLARVKVPPGSRLVTRLPGGQPSAPATEFACNAIEDGTLLWIVPPIAESLSTFLAQHVPATMWESGWGVTGSSNWLTDDPRGGSGGAPGGAPELIFTWVPLGSSGTGLRADALAIPPSSGCMSAGPAPPSGASQRP